MTEIILALRMISRDWRSGELTLLALALLVAVATVAAIDLFVDRLQRAMVIESSQILAADRVISGSFPIPDEWQRRAVASDLRAVRSLGFSSMVFAGDNNQLVSAKAVEDGYPLRGQLRVGDEPFVFSEIATTVPAPGEVWLDSRLMPAMGIRLGDVVTVGVADLRVTKVVISEPDQGGSFFGLGPRLLMNLADVAATEVVQPGSRVTYRLMLAGEEQTLGAFYEQIETELRPRFRWSGVRDGTGAVGSALDRAESFLLLGGLLGVILAGVAIALAAHRYSERHYDHVAVLKSLGMGPSGVRRVYLTLVSVVGGAGIVMGCVVGYGLHELVIVALRQLLPVELPAAGWHPFAVATSTGAVCLLAFALPPLLKLQNVSPMRVIRGDRSGDPKMARLSYAAGAAGCLALMIGYSGSLSLTAMVLAGAAAITAILMGSAWMLLHGGRALGMQAGSAWRLGMAALQRHGVQNSFQILVFALAIMLLLVLILVRTSLLDEWRAQLPDQAANHFLLNVVPHEKADVEAMLADETGEVPVLFPMIRGRIIAVNGEDPDAWARRHRGEFEPGPNPDGERNLTYSDVLPEGNTLMDGAWWPADDARALASVDQDFANSVGLKVGDRLTFSVIDRTFDAEIANLRKVDWDSFRPNFFLVFSAAAIRDIPATYMTSFYLPRERKIFLNQFLSRFPTVSVIEVDGLIAQVRSIVNRVTLAVELVLGLVLVSGGLVLVATILASLDDRVREHALVRTLGGSRRLILGALAIEFSALGAFAGLLAAVGTEVSVMALNAQIFDLSFQLHPVLLVTGPLLGVLIVGGLGLLATRRVLTTPPVVVLRST